MRDSKRYSPFLASWIAITVTCVAAFAVVTPALAQTGQAVVTTDLNMRSGPGTSYSAIAVIPRNTLVSVDNCVSTGWCEIIYGNRAGWASRNYLSFTGGVPPVVGVPQPQPVPPTVGGGVQAQTTVQLNMRTGPGTQYGTVRSVPAGGIVSLIQCTANYVWCEGTYANSRGWLSARYLRSTNPQYAQQPVTNIGAQLGLQLFNIIAGQLGLNVTVTPTPQPPRAPGANEVCFYTDVNYGGQGTCARMGQSDANLQAQWNDSISSIRIGAGGFVEVCQNANFGGTCRSYTADASQLPFAVNDRISSFRTTVAPNPGPIPGPTPVGGQACFYSEFNLTGQFFCLNRNETLSYVGNSWDNQISSIRVDPGVTVQVCDSQNFGGWCEQYNGNVPFLPAGRDNAISAIRVQ